MSPSEANNFRVAFAEVYPALERGILDAGVTGSTPGVGQAWFEVTKYLVGPIESRPHTLVTMSTVEWNQLPADLQRIIQEEGQQHIKDDLRLAASWDQGGVDELVAAGMEYSEFTQAMKAAMQGAMVETFVTNWVARVGGADSEAAKTFNRIVAPLVGVTINPNGSVTRSSG